jgi:hypothetical protein
LSPCNQWSCRVCLFCRCNKKCTDTVLHLWRWVPQNSLACKSNHLQS